MTGKVWFVTGAGRGLGVDEHPALLAVPLDGRAATPPSRRYGARGRR